jgi:hypothetical protein
MSTMLLFILGSLVILMLALVLWPRLQKRSMSPEGPSRPLDHQPGDGRPAGPDAEAMDAQRMTRRPPSAGEVDTGRGSASADGGEASRRRRGAPSGDERTA